jgi:hypothetical protein
MATVTTTGRAKKPRPPAPSTPDGILQLGLGFWGSKTLPSAIELGLFTELAKGPLDRLCFASSWQPTKSPANCHPSLGSIQCTTSDGLLSDAHYAHCVRH